MPGYMSRWKTIGEAETQVFGEGSGKMKIEVTKKELAMLVRNCQNIQRDNGSYEPPCAGCLLEGECESWVEELCEVVEDSEE